MRIDWNPNAQYEIRASPGVVSSTEAIARQKVEQANAAGKGTYAMGSRQGMRRPQGRWRATVVTADAQAMIDNATNNTLARVL